MSPTNRWLRYRCIGYLTGRGLIFGSASEVFPKIAIEDGKFPLYLDTVKHPRVDVIGEDFSIFSFQSFDYIFIGQHLETVANPKQTVENLVSKLKFNGHLIIALPLKSDPIPPILHSFTPELIQSYLFHGSWRLKSEYIQDGVILQIYKKLQGNKGVIKDPPPPQKRACIVRYGALGDMIILTPLIHTLANDGYKVTLNITPYAAAVLKYNPYVSNIILQERNAIPNLDLGEYWSEWKNDYEKYINLSESIEGSLLKVEGRRDFFSNKSWREETCDKNYYDWTMQLGGYPAHTSRNGELYFSSAEHKQASSFRNQFRDKFLILWSLNGSSHHKMYGLFEPVATDFLDSHPDCVIVTVGDIKAKLLEFEHPRLIPKCGEWNIRMSLAMTREADCIIGPESVITNAGGTCSTPTITLLSHSTHNNFCRYFPSDYCLAPDAQMAPCYPCHQLHYSRESCPIADIRNDETNEILASGPACAMGAISGSTVINRLQEVYSLKRSRL